MGYRRYHGTISRAKHNGRAKLWQSLKKILFVEEVRQDGGLIERS